MCVVCHVSASPRVRLTRAAWSLSFLLALSGAVLCVWASVAQAAPAYRPSPSSAAATAVAQRGKVSLAHITFASGNRQSSDQVFWEDVVAKIIQSQPARFTAAAGTRSEEAAHPSRRQSNMLLWTGNAVYTDISGAGVELVHPRTPLEIEKQYKALTQNTHYRSFVEKYVEEGNVVGVWDEHDMGLRRGADKNYSQARAVRSIYLKELLHNRPDIKAQLDRHEDGGLYHFTTIPTPAGSALGDVYKHAVCIVALDVVSLRDPYPNFESALLTPFPAQSGGFGQARKVKDLPQADLLGEAQWTWLEDIVRRYVAPQHHGDSEEAHHSTSREKEECALTVFASAWQVLLNDNKPFSGWDLFPASRTRLLALLKNYEASRFLFLSGHAELAEIGGIVASSNADVEQKRSSGVLGMYAKHFPLTPLTKYSRKLLPFMGSGGSPQDGACGHEHSVANSLHSANGLIEATSSGLTHSVANAPVVGRMAAWLVDGDTTSNTLSYRPEELVKKDRETTLEENAAASGTFRFMSRYILVGREAKPRRNVGMLQLLTPRASAKAFATAPPREQKEMEKERGNSRELEEPATMKVVGEEEDPRLDGYGSGPAAIKAFVDDNTRVFISLHATDDGSALVTFEASLAQLPDYRRSSSGRATKGKAHFVSYEDIPPFAVYNVPGEYPTIKRSILSRGCAELPCVHGKFFMFAKMAFILGIIFVVLAILAAVLITILLAVERRRELEEAKKLKME